MLEIHKYKSSFVSFIGYVLSFLNPIFHIDNKITQFMKKLDHNLIVIFLSMSLHIISLRVYVIFMPLLLLENRRNIVVICNWQFIWLSTIWKWLPYAFIFLYVDVVKVVGIENQTKFTSIGSRLESWWLWMTSFTHITISSTLLRLVCLKFHNSTTCDVV